MSSISMRQCRIAAALAVSLAAMFSLTSNASAVTNPQVSTNYNFGCTILNSGSVNCWGGSGGGELGNGSNSASLVPVAVSGIANATQITTGDEHACVLLADQSVRCWGDNSTGQLGDTTKDDRNTPVVPVGIGAVKQIASSDYTTCALLPDATIKCWGSNPADMLGQGNTDDVTTPVTITGFTNVSKIQAAPDNICALLNTGTVKCSGTNDQGELGNGTTFSSSTTPVDVIEVSSAIDLAAGNEFACALINNGTVKCWGEGGSSKNGNPAGDEQPTPTQVPGLTDVVSLAPGYNFMCGLINDRSVRCWGDNSYGQTGNGTTDSVTTPQKVQNLPTVQSLMTVAEASPCAIVTGGQVLCWGRNDYGQTGNGSISPNVLTPTAIPGLNTNIVPFPAQQVSLGVTGKAKVDRKKNYYTVTGNVGATPSQFVDVAATCVGIVKVTTTYKYPGTKIVKKRGKRIKRKVTKTKRIVVNPAWTVNGGSCSANFTVKKLPVKYLNKKSIAITAEFAGNANLAAFNANYSYKLPKVTIKKKKRR